MNRLLPILAAFFIATPALADHREKPKDHMAHQTGAHDHGDHKHDDHAEMGDKDHMMKKPAVDEAAAADEPALIALSRTPEIDQALADGGAPVVVEVLGVVCDFCAKAMNKTFGRRDEIKAVYVDLDKKTLNLVMASADAMTDADIDKLVVRSGYKTKAIHRGDSLIGDENAPDPS